MDHSWQVFLSGKHNVLHQCECCKVISLIPNCGKDEIFLPVNGCGGSVSEIKNTTVE